MRKFKFKRAVFFFLSLLFIVTLYLCHSAHYFHLDQATFLSFLTKIQSFSTQEALVYFCMLYILSSLFLVPIGLPLNLFAGMLWGIFWGGLLINSLAILVASLSFMFTRSFRHSFLDNFFKRYGFFKKYMGFFNRHDWQFIFAARLNPIVPFGISNYLFGLVPGLSFNRYFFATILGNFLPCFAFASVGAVLKTFSLHDNNVRRAFLDISIMLLLVSTVFLLKWTTPSRKCTQPKGSI